MPQNAAGDPWITNCELRRNSRLRLFCFPYAGGGASAYRRWSSSLSAHVEVCPVLLPGRERRSTEPPFRRLPVLVEELAHALLPLLDQPFAFFGHSMGALISFELARSLSKTAGLRPVHLFVSGCRAPRLPEPEPDLHRLPKREFLHRIRDMKGTPEELLHNDEFLEYLLPILRADFALCKTYEFVPDVPLECPISALGGTHDPVVSPDDLRGWCDETVGHCTRRLFSGDHFFLHSEEPAVLEYVAGRLQVLGPTQHALERRDGGDQ